MNVTLPGTLLMVKRLRPNLLRRCGLSTCRGQRWGPQDLQPGFPGDVWPRQETPCGPLCSSWESPAQHRCLLLRPLLLLCVFQNPLNRADGEWTPPGHFCAASAGYVMSQHGHQVDVFVIHGRSSEL